MPDDEKPPNATVISAPQPPSRSPAASLESPPQETPEDWRSDARRAFITQILVLLVTPLSVAVTVYLTDRLKQPTPNIQGASVSAFVFEPQPDPALADSLSSDPGVAYFLRDQLSHAFDAQGQPLPRCADWLVDHKWDSNCLPVYRTATASVGSMLRMFKRMESPARPVPFFGSDVSEMQHSMATIAAAQETFDQLENRETPRTGGVRVEMGVLNTGDSDGTVGDKALLHFNNKDLDIFASTYTPIKAHGFEQVLFDSPSADANGVLSGTCTVGQEPTARELARLVQTHQKLELTITIFMGKKSDRIEKVELAE